MALKNLPYPLPANITFGELAEALRFNTAFSLPNVVITLDEVAAQANMGIFAVGRLMKSNPTGHLNPKQVLKLAEVFQLKTKGEEWDRNHPPKEGELNLRQTYFYLAARRLKLADPQIRAEFFQEAIGKGLLKDTDIPAMEEVIKKEPIFESKDRIVTTFHRSDSKTGPNR